MSRGALHRVRRGAFWTGSVALLFSWLLLTGALAEQITLPGWAQGVIGALAAGLVVWGSLRSKVDRNESDIKDLRVGIEQRITSEMFTQAHDHLNGRLDRIERKLDEGGHR